MPQLFSPRGWSIRWRLTAWYVLGVLVILLIAGAIAYSHFRAEFIATADRSLSIKGAELVAEMTEGDNQRINHAYTRPALDASRVLDNASALLDRPSYDPSGDPVHIQVLSAIDGSVVASSRSIQPHGYIAEAFERDKPLLHGNGPRFYFLGTRGEAGFRAMLIDVPRSPYLLRLAIPWGRSENHILPVFSLIVQVALLFVVLSAIGGWLLVHQALQPIEEIVREAEKNSGGLMPADYIAARTVGNDEIGHLVRALNKLMVRVKHSIERQRQFTADASHDLRTPLTILRGEIEFALERERDPDEYRETLASALEETNRLIRIVTDLAQMARADSEAPLDRSKLQAVNVVQVCADVLRSREPGATAKGVRLEFDPAHRMIGLEVLGDAVALDRAIANLLDNAVRYNRPGGTVSIEVGDEDEFVTVSVSDTGIGIAADEIPHIFERFHRADKSRTSDRTTDQPSTGLGLAITRSIVESHGGHVTVSSQIGVGSRFVIYLPINRLDEERSEMETPQLANRL
jgi:two-component system OmpR family sensor kinase